MNSSWCFQSLFWKGCLRQRTVAPLLGLLLVTACTVDLQGKPIASIDARPAPSHVAVIPTEPADTGWKAVDTAMEYRRTSLRAGGTIGQVAIVRLDPTAYRVRVAYDSANPGRVSQWGRAVQPVAMVNGGYFDADKKATALVIFDGIPRGSSYEGFGGMVVINAAGEFELRSLRQQPYDASEQLQQAMQSAPMLIQPGGVLSELDADEDRSRRTIIARDTSGRILLIACDTLSFTLKEMGVALKDSDLELDAALNLDGGRSTGLYLRTATANVLIDSFESVPLVLIVDKKE
jgi:exopolysaccharide biosynthesis protein